MTVSSRTRWTQLLLGVICMAPAGLKLLLKLFGERGPDQDA